MFFNLIPFKVELFAPNQPNPVATWQNDNEGWSSVQFGEFEYTYAAAPSQAGAWQCAVRNLGSEHAKVLVTADPSLIGSC